MYSGNIGLSQNLEPLLEAAENLRSSPIQFLIVGEGAAKAGLIAKAEARNLLNVRFLTYQPKERLGESLTAADVHFIPLRRGLAGAIVPSKLYGILAAGVPFVAAVDEASEVTRVARATGAGLIIPPDSPSDLAVCLRWCMDHRDQLRVMGAHGRKMAEAEFSKTICVRRVEEAIVAAARPLMAAKAPAAARFAMRPAPAFA